jgi:hypothetical protein
MAYKANVIPVMIVSPGDVLVEREVARDVIHELNNIHAKANSAVLSPVGWDTHSSSELGKRGQELINERVLRDSDLLIAIFRHRIGTPTGEYPSGSVEEIKNHIAAGKPVMVYFANETPSPDADPEQLEGLRKFREWCAGNGIVRTYNDQEHLRRILDRELRIALNDNPYLSGLIGAAETWGGVGTPSVVMRPPGSDLANETRKLLIEASKDTNGMILQTSTIGGWGLQVNGKTLNEGDARSTAKWKAALEDLERRALIRAMGLKREVFELTDAGFTLADRLRAFADPAS